MNGLTKTSNRQAWLELNQNGQFKSSPYVKCEINMHKLMCVLITHQKLALCAIM